MGPGLVTSQIHSKGCKQADLVPAGGHEGVVALKHEACRALGCAGPGQVGVVDHAAHALARKHDGTGLDVNSDHGSCRPHLPTESSLKGMTVAGLQEHNLQSSGFLRFEYAL